MTSRANQRDAEEGQTNLMQVAVPLAQTSLPVSARLELMDSITDETKLLDGSYQEPEKEDDTFCDEQEEAAVFLCIKCKRPLGDTFGWMDNDSEERTVMLRAVSAYVTVKTEQVLSKHPMEYGCVYENLLCTGCDSCIGKIYRSTPKHLDFIRDLYCLSVDAIDSYTLGSSCVQIAHEMEEPITFETRSFLQEEIEKANKVLLILKAKLASLESGILLGKG